MKKIVDVGGPRGLSEDQRITMIGNKAMTGQLVGVLVEDDGDKIERYIKKVTDQFPAVELISNTRHIASAGGDIYLLRFKRRVS